MKIKLHVLLALCLPVDCGTTEDVIGPNAVTVIDVCLNMDHVCQIDNWLCILINPIIGKLCCINYYSISFQ